MSSGSDRPSRYRAVCAALATLTDRRLAELVDAAPVVATGVGGTSFALDVEEVPVFAKRIPLTDLERRPENVLSTANLFGLPAFCQYGVGPGAPGFGVWREVAANLMTTEWVLSGQCDGFPLMYHWRVLPGPPAREPGAEDRAERERAVEFWHGSPAIRERFAAVAGASASVVLFLERFPGNLRDWLKADPGARNEYIRRCAQTGRARGIPPGIAAIVTRYAPIAVVMNDFYWTLHGRRRTEPYPAEELDRVCAATGFQPILP